jgi:hypothetical protein
MVVDPQRRELEQGRSGEQHQCRRQPIGPGREQPPQRRRQREHQDRERDQRRESHRPALGRGAAHEGRQQEIEPGDRQVDDPRPVNVEPLRRAQPVLAQVIPILAAEQPGAHLHDPQIVVGVAEREALDAGPIAPDHVNGGGKPEEEHQRTPVALERVRFDQNLWPLPNPLRPLYFGPRKRQG